MRARKAKLLLATGKDNLCETCGRYYAFMECRLKNFSIMYKRTKCEDYYMSCNVNVYDELEALNESK